MGGGWDAAVTAGAPPRRAHRATYVADHTNVRRTGAADQPVRRRAKRAAHPRRTSNSTCWRAADAAPQGSRRWGPRTIGEGHPLDAVVVGVPDEPTCDRPSPRGRHGRADAGRAELRRHRVVHGSRGRDIRRRVESAREPGGDLAGQHACEGAGLGLPARVRRWRAASLYALCRVVDRAIGPGRDVDQRAVERGGRVARVDELCRAAPALRRPLLEQPDGVAVAAGKVLEAGLLQRRSQRDRDGVIGQAHALADRRDGRGVGRLRHRQLVAARRNRRRARPCHAVVARARHGDDYDDRDDCGYDDRDRRPQHATIEHGGRHEAGCAEA